MFSTPFALLVSLIFLPESHAYATCSGAAIGDTSCVLLTDPYYSQYQWATCLTAEYIRRISSYRCKDQRAVACWYQCQLELNGKGSGEVYDNCRCSSSSPIPIQATRLGPECYSPGGIDCSWYRDCLEERYPCEGTEGGYAIEYAERYCNLFNDHYNSFSPSGQMWVNGVRKCLQVALVPLLRPWLSKSCSDIRTEAFDSHPDCYVNPASGAPSICSLSCSDVWKAFYLVNVVGDALTSAPYETGNQMLGVTRKCFGTAGCIGIGTTTLSFIVPGLAAYRGTRLFLGITKISQFIAKNVNLDSNGIGWFPYDYSNDDESERRKHYATESDNAEEFAILLVDLKPLGLHFPSSTPYESGRLRNLDETIVALTGAVQKGLLSRIPVSIDGEEEVFGVSSLGQCGDTFCSNETSVIKLASAPGGAMKFNASYIFTAAATVVFLLMCFIYCIKT